MRYQPDVFPSLHWAGIDLAKLTFQIATWGHQDLCAMRVGSFDRTRKGTKQALAWLRSQLPEGARIGIVMEATAKFADEVACWLLDLDPELRVAIVNPGQTCAFIRSLGLRNKTDDLDARALAKYGQERKPAAWERPTPELAALKDLVRTRMNLVQDRTAMTLRKRDHKRAAKEATQALTKIIKSLKDQIEALDRAILAHVAANPSLAEPVKRFMSIKGVAIVTATTILAELGDLRRFPKSRQLVAFAGMSPMQRQSGTSLNGKARLCKQGSPRARAALYMAAACAARFNPELKATYEGLVSKGKHKRLALGAVMRKLLVLMRALLIAGHDWKPVKAAA